MRTVTPGSAVTAYPFQRRVASLASALGLVTAIVCTALAVLSLAGRVSGGAQLLIPAALGLCMGVLGHVALAVFDLADRVCGEHSDAGR